jgi:hypothetical protein
MAQPLILHVSQTANTRSRIHTDPREKQDGVAKLNPGRTRAEWILGGFLALGGPATESQCESISKDEEQE